MKSFLMVMGVKELVLLPIWCYQFYLVSAMAVWIPTTARCQGISSHDNWANIGCYFGPHMLKVKIDLFFFVQSILLSYNLPMMTNHCANLKPIVEFQCRDLCWAYYVLCGIVKTEAALIHHACRLNLLTPGRSWWNFRWVIFSDFQTNLSDWWLSYL